MSWWTKIRHPLAAVAGLVAAAYLGPEAYAAIAGGGSAAGAASAAGAMEAGTAIGASEAGAGISAAAGSGAGLGGVFSGSLPALGSLGAGALSYAGQQQTNSAQMAMAQQQMAFQAQQSSTAYQRATADMMAAGLNPMLGYSQGGASSGPGAQAQLGNALGAGASSALQGVQTLQGLQQSEAEIDRTRALTDQVRSVTQSKDLETKDRMSQMELRAQQTDREREAAAKAAIDFQSAREQWLSDIQHDTFSADSLRRKALAMQEQLKIPEAKAHAEWWAAHPGLGGWLDPAQSMSSTARNAAGALGALTGR